MKMKLALEAGPDTLTAAPSLGITGVPVDGMNLLDKGVTETLQPLRERNLAPCQVGGFFLNPLNPDPEALAASVRRMEDLIPLAAEAGCPWIAFPGGSCQPNTFGGHDPRNLSGESLDAAARCLDPLARLAEKHKVRLTLEPHLRSLLATPERSAQLCEKVGSPSLRVTFDVTNYYTFFDLLDPTTMIRRCGEALGPWCGLVHLKEVALAEGFHLHAGLVPMGAGPTDWGAVLEAAVPVMPADAWILVEHCANQEEAMASIQLLRSAAASRGIELS